MKARGLINLCKDVADGRKVIISLLPKGEALLQEMYPRAYRISEETIGRLNPAERIALLYLLKKIADDDEPET